MKSKCAGSDPIADDPLMALYGSGRDFWADEHADDYVRRVRDGWESLSPASPGSAPSPSSTPLKP